MLFCFRTVFLSSMGVVWRYYFTCESCKSDRKFALQQLHVGCDGNISSDLNSRWGRMFPLPNSRYYRTYFFV